MANLCCEHRSQQGCTAHLTLSSLPGVAAFVGEMFGFKPMSGFVSSGYEYENKDMKRNGQDGWV